MSPAADARRYLLAQCLHRLLPGARTAPAVSCWTTAHADVHGANLTEPLRLLGWEGWGMAPDGFDAAAPYAYSLLQPDTAARVRATFPVLGIPVGLAAEATVCAQLLHTAARGDNLVLEGPLRNWLRNSAAAEPARSPRT
ncbi:hypothetical protein [Streptomyces sp. NPDC085937]|uniref:hypothetical protein n=1 Tax=Streptomyces sp. NPDC085937 TaxID=3365742 RepID=UPI0037D5E469